MASIDRCPPSLPTPTLVVLTAPGLAASAWGPSAASAAACCEMDAVIDGDGLDAPIELDTRDFVDLDLGLTDFGFFVEPPIGDERRRLLEMAPTSSLGPGFTVTWTIGGQTEIVQDLYPYAMGGPLVHTEPGQVFSAVDDAEVRGGWFPADPQLVTGLRSVGLPDRTPPASRDTTSDSGSAPTSRPPGDESRPSSRWRLLGIMLAAVLLAGTAATVGVRRRRAAQQN
jgi:hypothetical protein